MNYSPSGYILGGTRAKAAPWLISISATPHDRLFIQLVVHHYPFPQSCSPVSPSPALVYGFFFPCPSCRTLHLHLSAPEAPACLLRQLVTLNGRSARLYQPLPPTFSSSRKQTHQGFKLSHTYNQISCTVPRATGASQGYKVYFLNIKARIFSTEFCSNKHYI